MLYLGEQSCPYWLYVVEFCGFEDGLELVGLICHISINIRIGKSWTCVAVRNYKSCGQLTVTSISSSATIRAANETASSEVDILERAEVGTVVIDLLVDVEVTFNIVESDIRRG